MRKYKYKVVKEKSRVSAMIDSKSPFALKYMPSENVYAEEGTLGIFVFKTRAAAEEWAEAWRNDEHIFDTHRLNLIVLRVLPIGRGCSPKTIASEVTSKDLKYFYSDNDTDSYYLTTQSMPGVMTYPAVFVVE